MLIQSDKTSKTISKINQSSGLRQYFFFDIEEAPKYHDMLSSKIQYRRYCEKLKYYIFQRSQTLRLDYLKELVDFHKIKVKWNYADLSKKIVEEQDLVAFIKIYDQENYQIYPKLDFDSIYVMNYANDIKRVSIIFTKFAREQTQLVSLHQCRIQWPKIDFKNHQLQEITSKELPKLFSLRNMEFFYRFAKELQQDISKYKKIYNNIKFLLQSINTRLFDFYLVKQNIKCMNDASYFINNIDHIFSYQLQIQNDFYQITLDNVKQRMISRIIAYVNEVINHLQLNHSFQIELRNRIYCYLEPQINNNVFILITDDEQEKLIQQEHDNLKNVILSYLTDFIQQL